MKPLPLLLAVLLALPPSLRAQEKSRFNLADTPEKPRFKVTDISWPAKPGEAEICLWRDDKLAAFSLGVDDNNAGDIEWWKEQTQLHNFRMTWFVITGRVDANRATGYWKQFNELQSLGNDIQSHSVTHLHMLDLNWGTPAWDYHKALAAFPPPPPKTPAKAGGEDDASAGTDAKKAVAAASPAARDGFVLPPAPTPTENPDQAAPAATPATATAAKPRETPSRYHQTPDMLTLTPEQIATGILWEYQQSKAQIEEHMPGKVCTVLAYPGGGFTKFNDRKTAAKIFRTARGARGCPNMANQTDYLSTNAMSSWNFEAGKYAWGNVNNIIDPKLYAGRYYRGWLVLFQHQANKDLLAKTFDFMETNRDKLWIGLYAEVGQYGQERDTATLKVESVQPDKITLNLTDEMDDSYFNYPLTVKVHLPDDWKAAAATQGGKAAAVQIVTHDGAPYALVQAVPDAGPVILSKG